MIHKLLCCIFSLLFISPLISMDRNPATGEPMQVTLILPRGIHLDSVTYAPIIPEGIALVVSLRISPELRTIYPGNIILTDEDLLHFYRNDRFERVLSQNQESYFSLIKPLSYAKNLINPYLNNLYYWLRPLDIQPALVIINQCHTHMLNSLCVTDNNKRDSITQSLSTIHTRLLNAAKNSYNNPVLLKKLTSIKYIITEFEDASPTKCPICLEHFSDQRIDGKAGISCTFPCNHAICITCNSKMPDTACPVCRAAI